MAGILEIRRGSSGIALADGEFYLNKGINAVQIGSGSAILTLVPLNRLINGDIILNGNIYANNLTGSAQLPTAVTTNVNVGGIDSGTIYPLGTPLEDILSDLLVKFQDSTLSGLSLRQGVVPQSFADREVGDGFPYDRVLFNSTAENPIANYPINATITQTDSANDYVQNVGTISATNNINVGSRTVNKSSPGNVIITVAAKRSDNSVFITPLSASVAFKFKNVLAASATNIISNATAQTVYDTELVDFELSDDIEWIADCTNDNNTSTKFTYIIYPSTYPDITSVSKGSSDVTTAFTFSGTYIIVNNNGVATSYKIYKSTQPGAYRLGDKLTIK